MQVMAANPFKDRYSQLPANEQTPFRNKIMDLCGISEPTFYRWLSGGTERISKLAKQVIADAFGCEAEEVFPTEPLG